MNLNLEQFKDLDIDNIGDWPGLVKGFFSLIAFAIIIGLVYYFDTQHQVVTLEQEQAKEIQLKDEFETKQRKAVNLQSYRDQMTEMCDSFQHMLRQLPTSTEIPGLIDDISQSEAYSGLEFEETKYLKERKAEFYTEKPVRIKVSGSYHQLGMFVSRVSSLPRIVTMHNYDITKAKQKKNSEKERLSLSITAKTYRYDSNADKSACAKLRAK